MKSLSTLLSKIKQKKKIFVIDEYDGEDLDKSEAETLNKIFNGSLEEAFIVVIAQPIKK